MNSPSFFKQIVLVALVLKLGGSLVVGQDANEPNPTKPTTAKTDNTGVTTKVSDAADIREIPDISGVWRSTRLNEVDRVLYLRRFGNEEFEVCSNAKSGPRHRFHWVPSTKKFETAFSRRSLDGKFLTIVIGLEIDSDVRSMRVNSYHLAAGGIHENEQVTQYDRTSLVLPDQFPKLDPELFAQEQVKSEKSDHPEHDREIAQAPSGLPEKKGTPVNRDSEPREIKIFTLANGSAADYSVLLKTLYRNAGITADPRTNSIVVAGHHDELQEIEAILMRLDSSNASAVARGSAGAGSATVNLVQNMGLEQLSVGIAEHEAKARLLAEQIRKQSESLGNKHPDLVKNQMELEKTLSAALALKFQLEQSQLEQLEARLSRMQSQFKFRKAASRKMVERRMRELLDGEALDWNVGNSNIDAPATAKVARETESSSKRSTSRPRSDVKGPESLPTASTTTAFDPSTTPTKLRLQFEPLAKQVASARERVRELEVIYFKDRSRAAELQLAWDRLVEARGVQQKELIVVHREIVAPLTASYTSATENVQELTARQETQKRLFRDGKLTEKELEASSESVRRANAKTTELMANMETLDTLFRSMGIVLKFDDSSQSSPPEVSQPLPSVSEPVPTYPQQVAEAWLEEATQLKLELVTFDDLKIGFTAALRVRENGNQFRQGDLIVTLNGRTFATLDQAIAALRPTTTTTGPFGASRTNSLVHRGGLSGELESVHVGRTIPDFLVPEDLGRSGFKVELRSRLAGTDDAETKYMTGTCVAPDGLIVIPIVSKSLVADAPIIVFGNAKGTAHVVASDDERGLTLLKLDIPSRKLFPWTKCRPDIPTRSQQLTICHPSGSRSETSIGRVGLSYHAPLVGNDAFTVRDHQATIWLGTSLGSVDGDLQGIVYALPEKVAPKSLPGAVPTNEPPSEVLAIPAVHIQKLIDDYRKDYQPAKSQTEISFVPDGDTRDDPVWKALGLKLEPTADANLIPKPYRSGLLVTDVVHRLDNTKPQQGKEQIRQGDILVGLWDWQTTSVDNVLSVLCGVFSGPSPDPLAAYLVRDGKVFVANVRLHGGKSGDLANKSFPEPPEISLDMWLDILQKNRDSEHAPTWCWRIAHLGTGPDVGRAAEGLLAAAEFPIAGIRLIEVLKQLSPVDTLGVKLKALRDGHPRVKQMALASLSPLKDYATATEFPALAEELFKFGTGPDPALRISALDLLIETLPLSKLDPAGISTEERRMMVKSLSENTPRHRIVEQLRSLLDDSQVNVALAGADRLLQIPDEATDQIIRPKLLDVLGNIAKGKHGDVIVSHGKREQGLVCLYTLFHAQGSDIKEMLPEMEAILSAYQKIEREDALFSKKAVGQSPAETRLQQLINLVRSPGPITGPKPAQ